MENNLLIFLHLMAAAVGVGSLVFCLFFLLPAAAKLPERNIPVEYSIPYRALDVLAPAILAAILALIGTGVYFLLTNYTRQVDLAPGYYNLFGVKMIFAILALFLSVYQTCTLRPRISDLDLSPESRELVPAVLQKMKTLGQVTLAALSIAVFLGLWLARY